jgi:hypothetical protein
MSVFCLRTWTYSESDSPSLATGLGGNAPGIGPSPFHPEPGLPSLVWAFPVFGRDVLISVESELFTSSSFVANVSPGAVLCLGLDLPFRS